MVAVFINLDDSDPDNGGLAVFPGSHKLGPQENKSDVLTHFYVDQASFKMYFTILGSTYMLIIILGKVSNEQSSICECQERSSVDLLILSNPWQLPKCV
jgi:hypothetical protein